jgi:CelD/BcsL family acetyltransferase involved in cellulose biosynthesis
VPRRAVRVGFWALRERRIPLMPTFLETLPYEYAFTSNAVIDGTCVDEVVAAFFETIRRDARLPKTISLRSFEADPVVYPAILRHLEGTGRHRETVRLERPFADLSAGIKRGGSTGKKQRSDWNKLSAMGTTEVVNDRTPDGVATAFETFMALEVASWKGDQGTALLCDPDHARFTRRLIGNLAARGLASVALLCVAEDPIAAQVVLYNGRLAYTWKTAFKTAYARYSPGALLINKIADSLLASGQTAVVDSCSSPDGFMAQMWTGRRSMVDALIDVGSRGPLAFAVEAAQHRSYDQFCRMRDKIRTLMLRPSGPAQKIIPNAARTAAATAAKPAAKTAVTTTGYPAGRPEPAGE